MGRTPLRGGRIVDPSQGVDWMGDLLVEDGKVAGMEWIMEEPVGRRLSRRPGW